jgi:hypothetical protein
MFHAKEDPGRRGMVGRLAPRSLEAFEARSQVERVRVARPTGGRCDLTVTDATVAGTVGSFAD